MSESLRVTVLASGSGTNLQALIDRLHLSSDSRVSIARVIGSRPGIGALERAARFDIPTGVQPSGEAGQPWLAEALSGPDADLIVLAGWLKLIPEAVVRACRGRMINIHPALLPSFGGSGMYGRRVHEAVVASGTRVSGATIHFVDEIYDHGAIIAQWPVPVLEEDDPETLAARVLAVEHRLLPAVVQAFADEKFALSESGRVVWAHPWFPADMFTMQAQVKPD